MTNPDAVTHAQRLQAIEVVELLNRRDRPAYLSLFTNSDPSRLAHDLAYVAAFLLESLAAGDPARSAQWLETLRIDARADLNLGDKPR